MSLRADTPSKFSPVYLFVEGSVMLDAPVNDAWRHVMNYSSWQSYSSVEHVSGNPGHEGEVVLLRPENQGFEFPPYYGRTIRIDPLRTAIWKTYPETGGGIEFFGIVQFKLHDAENKTRFCYDILYEFLVPSRDENELDAFRKRQNANFDALFSSVFQKLKKLVEARG